MLTGSRPRRSELATPASNEHMCEVAARSGADLVFLDLEDACAPAAKESARATAVDALTGLDWGSTIRAVRINGLDTPWCYGDIVEVVTGARDALDVIIVPKVLAARDVWWVDVLLTQLETKLGLTRPIALEALIEEADGLLNAAEIARASPRLQALIFGAGDLSASLHARVDGNFRRPVTIRATTGTRCGCRCWRPRGPRASPRSMRRTRDIGTKAATGAPRHMPPAGLRRKVGDPSVSGADRQRGLHPDGGGTRGSARDHGRLSASRGRRGRRGRPQRKAGRRSTDAARGQRAAPGSAAGDDELAIRRFARAGRAPC